MKKGAYTTPDGVEIYYKDWGTGPVVTFSHGWPLSADAWDAQMLFLGQKGYRIVAHDRRGHGRSGQSWQGNNMDQYADDFAGLLDHLDIKDATMAGHSTGGGEVVPLHRTSWREGRRQGCPDRSRSSAHATKRG